MENEENDELIKVGSITIEVEACGHGHMNVFIAVDGLGELEVLGAIERAKSDFLNADIRDIIYGDESE